MTTQNKAQTSENFVTRYRQSFALLHIARNQIVARMMFLES